MTTEQPSAVVEGLRIVLRGTDPDGTSLTYTLLSTPSHGTLFGAAPTLTYTPDANYNGSDSFTFKVNDGQVDSNVATVRPPKKILAWP